MLVTGLLTLQTMFVGAGSLGEIIHVPTDYPTIQLAIEFSQRLDTIIVAPGTYYEAINVWKDITLQSINPNDPNVVGATIINAGGLGNVVTFANPGGSNPILDGLTITGGTIGIDAHRIQPRIRHCIIRDNSSSGIYQASGMIEDCQILNNNVGIDDCPNCSIQRCVIQGNKNAGVKDGGYIEDSRIEGTLSGHGVHGGNGNILRSIIAGNAGSGIYAHTGGIWQSMIVGNSGYGINGDGRDGGVGLYGVENCVIAGNANSGIYNSRKAVLSCTVTENHGFGFQTHSGTISHVIIWGNLLGALSSSTSPVFSGTMNPYFAQPGLDYHLSPNSPYIDIGNPAYVSIQRVDFDGNPRIVGARVDIGAYEFQGEPPQCDGPDFDDDGIPDMCDVDLDGDGIPNAADHCEYTPLGVTVNFQGRPVADLNLDCIVDLRDYALFQRDFFGP